MIKLSKSIDKDLPVYISGPITSLCKLGMDWRAPFREAETSLRRLGFRQIHSPVDIAAGVDTMCAALGRDAMYSDYMKADIEMLGIRSIIRSSSSVELLTGRIARKSTFLIRSVCPVVKPDCGSSGRAESNCVCKSISIYR